MRTRRSRVLVALVAVTATIAAAALVTGPGYQTRVVRMTSGSAWLASTQTGEATLLDGASAEVKSSVQIAGAGTALEVAQMGGTATTLNRETGEFRTIDGATERASAPVAVLPASEGLTLLPAAEGVYAIDVHSGRVVQIDPTTWAPRDEPVQLAESIRPGSAVTDATGRLWAVDDTSGDLVWLDGNRKRSRAGVGEHARLAIAQGYPVLVDPEHGTVELINPENGLTRDSVRTDPAAGGAVVVGGSNDLSRVHLMSVDRGELVTCAFSTHACSTPVQIGAAGDEFGAPVEVDDHVVVPDYSTGQATILDLKTSRVVAERQLFDRPTRFELRAFEGIVFFNDANGDRAGVLELSGEVRAVTKYTGKPADDVPFQHDDSGQHDQAVQVGNDKQKPGSVGVPGRDVKPSRVEPRPGTVAASILVRPGHQGVVGDEFDLTMVVPTVPGVATADWQFGDGAVAAGGTVRHRWQQAGTFTVRAVSTLPGGLRAEAETTVIVDPAGAPIRITALNVQRPRPVLGESVRFTADTTAVPDGWSWTVTRNGNTNPEVTARTADFTHTFAEAGVYTLSLTITAGLQTAQSSREVRIARGAVKAWSSQNINGEATPPPSVSSGVKAISTGWGHALALKTDGSVKAWGDQEHGLTEIPPPAWSGVKAISAGRHNMVLKDDGSVFSWGGGNFNGELQLPDEVHKGVIAISAGALHSLALKDDGRVIAWGYNGYFGLTDVPQEAQSGVIAIAAGGTTNMALKADGTVVVWGESCRDLAPSVADAVAIAMTHEVCFVIKRNGSVFAWGGPSMAGEDQVPPQALSGVVGITARGAAVLALKEDGTAVGWGYDGWNPVSVPAQINRGVLAVSTGGGFSTVLLEDLE
ncbi:PKD domain-containing protein [Lentzea sp. HUAS TT2]|uniref:PKD domain-containing protein n=1 Tax=Lentzea sp. HUAS TT2 TaxID=3447454 RepID=UPI003F72E87F